MITRLTSSSSRFGVNEYHQELESWVSRLRKRLQTRQRLMWGGSKIVMSASGLDLEDVTEFLICLEWYLGSFPFSSTTLISLARYRITRDSTAGA